MVLRNSRTRPFISLVLFSVLVSCSPTERETSGTTIRWQDEQAVALIIPRHLVTLSKAEPLEQAVTVNIQGADGTPMLGSVSVADDHLLFEPLIPLSRGKGYEVRVHGELVETVNIPLPTSGKPPVVVNIYPSGDTIPENLLKVYQEFSNPMQVGRSLEHVVLLQDARDTIKEVFLELHPELWNNEATVLTLWLDPGRIKRDLQPNVRMGKPLEAGTSYTLVISDQWADGMGVTLAESFSHTFIVTGRDSLSPDPDQWILLSPRADSRDSLIVRFGEPLDAILLREAITVETGEGHIVDGEISVSHAEKSLMFKPDVAWTPGRYHLQCEGRLEDLAGNNLNRPFDRDLLSSSARTDQAVFRRAFTVK
jgi:hypothetical protein